MVEAEKASRAHLSGHDGSDGRESSGAHGAPAGLMQSSVDSSSIQHQQRQAGQANLGVRHSKQTEADILQVFPRREGTFALCPGDMQWQVAGRTKEKQAAALGAEKLGGDESREVVTGGKLGARA